MRTLTATSREDGEWDFHCPLHSDHLEFRVASSEANAMNILKEHVDLRHPGIKVRIQIRTKNHTTHTTYTGTETVPTGDIL
jgi:hypothetical protein